MACIGQDVLGVSTVVVENRLGAAALAAALHRAGHRRFGVLAGPPGTSPRATAPRASATASPTSAPSRPPEHVIACEFTRDGAYAATAELLEPAGPRWTACSRSPT